MGGRAVGQFDAERRREVVVVVVERGHGGRLVAGDVDEHLELEGLLPLAGGESGPELASSDILTVAFGGLLVSVLTVALGVGVGVLVRNQVAGVVGALIWLFILSPVLGLIDEELPDYTTLPAAGVVGGSHEAGGLSYGTSVVVLVAWAAVFFAVGLLLERRRDVD